MRWLRERQPKLLWGGTAVAALVGLAGPWMAAVYMLFGMAYTPGAVDGYDLRPTLAHVVLSRAVPVCCLLAGAIGAAMLIGAARSGIRWYAQIPLWLIAAWVVSNSLFIGVAALVLW